MMAEHTPKSRFPSRRKVRLAIVGTGGMANQHALRFSEIHGCSLASVFDVNAKRASSFAERHQIPQVHESAEALFEDPTVDAVSIVTPDGFHAPLSIAALEAGKHVLCEKPLALNYPDAARMLNAAERSGKMHMVNLSYRDWPAIQAIAKSVSSGEIGDVRHVEASYLQAWLVSDQWGDWRTSPTWLWRLSTKHGSNGVLGDVGVHIVDFASFPVGPIESIFCQLRTFPKCPENHERVGEYVLDANDSAVMNVSFANGALGTIHTTRWCGGHANRLALKIGGTRGTVSFDSDLGTSEYRICSGNDLHENAWRTVAVKPTPNNYRRFIRAIQTARPPEPTFAAGTEAQRVLDTAMLSAKENRPISLAEIG